MNLVILIKF